MSKVIILTGGSSGIGRATARPVFRRKYYESSEVNKRSTIRKAGKASKYWGKSQYFFVALFLCIWYNDSTS